MYKSPPSYLPDSNSDQKWQITFTSMPWPHEHFRRSHAFWRHIIARNKPERILGWCETLWAVNWAPKCEQTDANLDPNRASKTKSRPRFGYKSFDSTYTRCSPAPNGPAGLVLEYLHLVPEAPSGPMSLVGISSEMTYRLTAQRIWQTRPNRWAIESSH